MNKEYVAKKYKDVGASLEKSLDNTNAINLIGSEENLELNKIKQTLKSMNDDFKCEIFNLQASSEWDKFCISFFGETNAGKSTIIESLRIIYDEESRRAELEDQKKEYIKNMEDHNLKYSELINSLKELSEFVNNRVPKKNLIPVVLKNLAVLGCGFTIGLILAATLF